MPIKTPKFVLNINQLKKINATDAAAIPGYLLSGSVSDQPVNFIPYASQSPVIRGKSSLKKHLISLITDGEKLIHVAGKQIHVTPKRILLLAAGNYLYTERFDQDQQVKSTMIFFDDELLQNVLHQLNITKVTQRDTAKQPFALFEKDDYLRHYIESVQSLIKLELFAQPLQLAKLQELLVYLFSKYPETLVTCQLEHRQRPDEEKIRQVMEENLPNSLSLAELAFLCHMSLPTFKRKFQLLYQQSPARWLQERRLTLAADLLRRKGARPGDVYMDAGYENHSSFSQAFKLQFGVLPKDY